jgi:hypothetical protein
MSKIPDFGMHRITVGEGTAYPVELECKYIAPGLTFQDVTKAFFEAEKDWEPGDDFGGNPAKWKNFRGISAVVDAVLEAVYSELD